MIKSLAIVALAGVAGPALGADSPVRFEKKVLSDQYLSDGIDAADVDRDGHLDVVAGQWWFRGPEFSERREFTVPEKLVRERDQSGNKLTFVYDFNGDGWTDILVIGRVHMHPAYWYANPGKGIHEAGHWKKHYVYERIKGESPPFADLTGDGRPEIVTHDGARWGYVSPDWGDATQPWVFHPIAGTEGKYDQFYHGTGVGDVNGDGRADLILNHGWYERPADLSAKWGYHPQRFGTKGGAQMFAYDVDQDGDADVVSSLDAHGWGLAWFEQVKPDAAARTEALVGEKRERVWKQNVMMNTREEEGKHGAAFTQPHALALGDVDGDAAMDVVTGKRYWAHGPKGDIEPMAEPVLYWFKLLREGATAKYVPYEIDRASGVGTQVRVMDVNRDGKVDVLTTGRVGTFVFLSRK